MSQRRHELLKLMKDLKMNENTFSEEDLRLFEKGGFSVTESDDSSLDTESLRDSLSSSDYLAHNNIGAGNLSISKRKANEYELLNMKTKFTSIISMLEKQNALLQNDIKRVVAAHDAEKRKMLADFQSEQEKLRSDVKTLRQKHIQSESQIPLIKEAFSQVRDMLNGLVPESTYLKLRDIPESDLSPNEWVLVNVWDLVYPFKKDSQASKKEIATLREEIRQLSDKLGQQLNELEHTNKMLFDKEEDHKRHKLNYESSRRGLEMQLEKLQEELEGLREKSLKYDDLHRDFKRVEQEKVLLEDRLGFVNTAGKVGERKTEQSELFRIQDELRRKNDILSNDKDYLTKENISLLEKNKRLDDRCDKLEAEVLDAKNKAQEYLFQLLNQRNDSSLDYEKRINKEINELKEKHIYEMEVTKNNIIEIYEKQIRFLKEAKEDLEIKLDTANSQVREKQQAYDTLMLENRGLQRKVEADLSDIRVQYRLKSDELDRISNIYEETLANLKSTKLENDMLRDKINVLKSEYYKVEITAKEETANIKAQLAVAREQLANYEAIEKDIDDAIIGMSGSLKGERSDNVYLNTLHMAPTSSKRRIQQALSLAQRLQAKQKESEEMGKRMQEQEGEIEKLKEEALVMRDLLDKTHQPYSYLISSVEEKEREILKYKQLLRKSEQDFHYLKQEHSDLKEAFEKAEKDINKLLIKRENIQNIQNILLRIANNEQENVRGEMGSLIADIQDILGNRTKFDPLVFQPCGTGKLRSTIDTVPTKGGKKIDDDNQSESRGPAWYEKLKKTLKK